MLVYLQLYCIAGSSVPFQLQNACLHSATTYVVRVAAGLHIHLINIQHSIMSDSHKCIFSDIHLLCSEVISQAIGPWEISQLNSSQQVPHLTYTSWSWFIYATTSYNKATAKYIKHFQVIIVTQRLAIECQFLPHCCVDNVVCGNVHEKTSIHMFTWNYYTACCY